MTISARLFCESIYCAYVPMDALEPDRQTGRIAFDAEVADNGLTMLHRVAFDGVRGLTRKSSRHRVPEAGDRLELSVIELEREADGWRVWLNPWYLDEIEFHCDGIHLDASEVVGTGRWLQDTLPSRPAG